MWRFFLAAVVAMVVAAVVFLVFVLLLLLQVVITVGISEVGGVVACLMLFSCCDCRPVMSVVFAFLSFFFLSFFLQISGLFIFVVFIGTTVVIVVTAADYYFSSMLIQPAGRSFCGPVSTDRPEMDAHCSFVRAKERVTPH